MKKDTAHSMLAPIVLFVYNRPWHTAQTLQALMQNELANQSVLYIFADGPKENAYAEDLKKISYVRQLIKEKPYCKEVHIFESSINKGLADSIVEGVTTIVNKYGKVIVLEDDIVTSPGFLKYMNDALQVYENEEKVFHISGYMFPVRKKLPSTFFYKPASCWGWATWQKKWNFYNNDAAYLLNQIDAQNLKYTFNIADSYDYYWQLVANKNNTLKTWAVKWYASAFLKKGLSLHPYPSLTQNIGNDGMGENCRKTNVFQWKKLAKAIEVKKINIEEDSKTVNYIIEFNKKISEPRKSKEQKVKSFFFEMEKKIIPNQFQIFLKRIINKD